MPYNETPEPGSLFLQGKIVAVHTKAGAKGAHIRVHIDFPHEPGNVTVLDNMSGKGIDVKVSGPIQVSKDTEHPDQTHFGDPSEGGDA